MTEVNKAKLGAASRKAAWPQQPHKTPVLTLARASSLGVEGTRTPQEAMGEPPQAVVMKTFGGPDETCEVLAEFLDWRASEEKRHQGYLEMSEAKRRRIEAEFERLFRLLAEQERTMLGWLAGLDDTFTATHAKKSLRVAEGVAQLYRLIVQLESRMLGEAS
ncbi:tripartite motif-containing protein 15-like isoform X2 [Motacilla alba alba]|uniref:tripartite motif-containing protein 15-like isoform X2 n=1 Tax=Motacilla alba alba TaxID=1094192 RepID=UPI0018D4F963|nr:tripartite motif-containing protein 15-like isoform X2 [Motacilla alba alba]